MGDGRIWVAKFVARLLATAAQTSLKNTHFLFKHPISSSANIPYIP
jgi:hypothetical protein